MVSTPTSCFAYKSRGQVVPDLDNRPKGCAILLVAGFNSWNMMGVFSELRATGGVGFMSDAITRFSESARNDTNSIYLFPDWGLHMPFVMITHGSTEVRDRFDAAGVEQALLSSRDVVLATIGSGAKDRRDSFAKSAPLPLPALSEVLQRDDTSIIFIARWQHN
jgi:hypothetical protein